MPKEINLRSPTVKKHKSQVATYGTQTPLSSTAVERGSTRWLAGSYVSIEGILDVAGTFNVSGTTVISGSLTIAGQTGITGPLTIQGVTDITGQLNVTGPTTLDGILDIGGDTTISGTLDIQGVTTLNNDLKVQNNGKIKVGTNMTLTPADDGGSIVFQDGSKVTSVGGTVQAQSSGAGGVTAGLNSASISTGNALISVDDLGDWSLAGTNVTLQTVGGTADLNGSLDVSGNFINPGLQVINERVKIVKPYPSGMQPNVYMDENGYLCRTNWVPA